MSVEMRRCLNCATDFTIEPADFDFYASLDVPAPAYCPNCRLQQRLAHRNNRVFYKRPCDLCAKPTLNTYRPESPFTVYCHECWNSDRWDPMSYARDYDFSQPFFTQFRELQDAVPRPNLYQTNFVASEYCNYGLDFKECYLLYGGRNNERVYFGNQIRESRDSLDIAYTAGAEFSYDLFECHRTNKLFFSRYSEDCFNSSYLVDCRGCSDCYGCVNLRSKQYHIWNQPHTKAEYEAFVAARRGSYAAHREALLKLRELVLAHPRRYARIYKSVNSDGDDLFEVNNVHDSYASCWKVENSRFQWYIFNGKDSYDASFNGYDAERLYQIAHGFGGSHVVGGLRNLFNNHCYYTEECHNSSNLIGCEGLMKKSYCILNKQYSKEEYEALAPKIIEHMKAMPYTDKNAQTYRFGDFWPIELSPFAYNETIAQENFPLTKEQALEQGYAWKEPEARQHIVTVPVDKLSDNIRDVADSIVNEVIGCDHGGACTHQCTPAFRILPFELQFYRQMSIPLPRLCPNCRHFARIGERNPLQLWKRECGCGGSGEEGGKRTEESIRYKNAATHFHMSASCPNGFKTTYSPERKEIVYCEQCYQAEVV